MNVCTRETNLIPLTHKKCLCQQIKKQYSPGPRLCEGAADVREMLIQKGTE